MKPFRFVISNESFRGSRQLGLKDKTRGIMLDVIIALLPALVWGIIAYGPRAALIAAISVASCVFFELVFCFIAGRSITVTDLSAIVTGLILAMTLPASVPLYLPLAGSFFAIIVVKELFGGIGNNWLNPALSGRLLLYIFRGQTTVFTKPFEYLPAFTLDVGEQAAAAAVETSLDSVNQLMLPEESFFDLFLGKCAGSIGEISAVLLIIGGIYLAIRKVINIKLPLTYLAALGAMGFLFPFELRRWDTLGAELLTGCTMLVAFFCVCDYSTIPLSRDGRTVFAVGCGVLTFYFRQLGLNIDGAILALLSMNVISKLIDAFFTKKPRGYISKSAKIGKKSESEPAFKQIHSETDAVTEAVLETASEAEVKESPDKETNENNISGPAAPAPAKDTGSQNESNENTEVPDEKDS